MENNITKHIFLSPHYDDAAYSCGATINRLTDEGNSVKIINIFGGAPTDSGLSEVALEFHQVWQGEREELPTAAEIINIRQAEDATAAKILGAQTHTLPIPECLYRKNGDNWIYTSEDAVFGTISELEIISPNDLHKQVIKLLDPAEPSAIYCPMSLGSHVDHQLVYRAFSDSNLAPNQLIFYADYPHARGTLLINQFTANGEWANFDYPVREQDVSNRIKAMTAYESQLPLFWESSESLEEEIVQLWKDSDNSERFWIKK